ncbi:hypothetical protein KGQ19_01385 [Catenulispora sp. NL8]|uniref:Uncharacterized protein n=1 Tax=Catenulispora pinistramenti TaxID=2705254 RepID=A0ABS5KH11_9ACTN|nr:hypothetical protein [Catenulispora pinistramenti]MBS2545513.1 hypothetical protein [Catenulispora pinistramenti]
MSPPPFHLQRQVGEALLAAGWHAASIAVASKPGSAWSLSDPEHRIRVRMSADLGSPLSELTAVGLPCRYGAAAPWRLVIHHAPSADVVASALEAPEAARGGGGTERRAVGRALESCGMRCDRGRLAQALSGIACWTSPDHRAEAVWLAACRAQHGGWVIHTAAALLQATSEAPAAVLIPLINADPVPGATP